MPRRRKTNHGGAIYNSLQEHFDKYPKYNHELGLTFPDFVKYVAQKIQEIYSFDYKDPFNYKKIVQSGYTDDEEHSLEVKNLMDEFKRKFNIECPRVISKTDIESGLIVYCGKRELWDNLEEFNGTWGYQKRTITMKMFVPSDVFIRLKANADNHTGLCNFEQVLNCWRIYIGYKYKKIRNKGSTEEPKNYAAGIILETYRTLKASKQTKRPIPSDCFSFLEEVMNVLSDEINQPTECPKLPPPVLKLYEDDLLNKRVVYCDDRVLKFPYVGLPFLGHNLIDLDMTIPVVEVFPCKNSANKPCLDYIGDTSIKAKCVEGNPVQTEFYLYKWHGFKRIATNIKPGQPGYDSETQPRVPRDLDHEFYRDYKVKKLASIIEDWSSMKPYRYSPEEQLTENDWSNTSSDDSTLDLY